MKATVGDVVLLEMPRTAGRSSKLRPALVLARLPGPYQTWLVCGVSTQTEGLVDGWDEVLEPQQPWFAATGLHRQSAVRLSFLSAVDEPTITGRIGVVPRSVVNRQRRRLASLLTGSGLSPAGVPRS